MVERTLTGTVVDAGDGVTHIIPVADGYVIGSCIKHIPLAGRDITNFIQLLMREREFDPARRGWKWQAREGQYCYVCPDMAKEFRKYDDDPAKWIKKTRGETKRGQLGSATSRTSVSSAPKSSSTPRSPTRITPPRFPTSSISASRRPPSTAPQAVQEHRLSGGSTMFKDFGKRPQLTSSCVDARIKTELLSGGRLKPQPVEVNVISHRAASLSGSVDPCSPPRPSSATSATRAPTTRRCVRGRRRSEAGGEEAA